MTKGLTPLGQPCSRLGERLLATFAAIDMRPSEKLSIMVHRYRLVMMRSSGVGSVRSPRRSRAHLDHCRAAWKRL